MKTLECKNRKAFSISIEKIMVIAIAIVAVGVLAAFGGDLIGTASVVETMDLSKQSLYAEQEFITVTIKNSGTTALNVIKSYVLIDSITNCGIGNYKASIGDGNVSYDLAPGESVTISGDLKRTNSNTDIVCGGTGVVDITERTEYILQVDGESEGGEIISTTSTVRAR